MEWISVKDRLPEKQKIVIICTIGSDFIKQKYGETLEQALERCRKEPAIVELGFLGSDGGWYEYEGFPAVISPSYWMPLPEPPKEEQK